MAITIPGATPGDGQRVPSAAELQARPHFQQGRAAQHPFGVLYQGEYETLHDGTAVAVRKHARALANTGLPVLLRSFSNMVVGSHGVPQPVHAAGMHPKVLEHIGDLRATEIGTLVPLIKHVVVRSAEHLHQLLIPRSAIDEDPGKLIALRQALYRATIVYSVWERDRIDPDLAELLGRVAENWVPCRQNADMLIASGVPSEKVRVVPHPYDPGEQLTKLVRRRPKRGKHFYSIGRWEPRKGYHELLGAFLLAFRPGENVTLTIKTNHGRWDGYPTPESSLEEWLNRPEVRTRGWDQNAFRQHVTILGEVVGADKIVKLHFDNNIYVASSHGEAFCVPAFEAKIAGNRMVHVPFGGTADFSGDGDVEVDYHLGPVHPSYRWPETAQWATFGAADLVAALLAVEPPERFERPDRFEETFGAAAVGRQMADAVLSVAERCHPHAAAYLRERLGSVR